MIGDAADIAVAIVAIGHRSVVGVRHLQELVQAVIAVGRLVIVAVGQARHATDGIYCERLRFERAGEGDRGQVALAVVAEGSGIVFAVLFAGNRPIEIVRVGCRGDTRPFGGGVLCRGQVVMGIIGGRCLLIGRIGQGRGRVRIVVVGIAKRRRIVVAVGD